MYKRCRLTWNFYLFPPSSNQKQFHLWNDAIRRNGPIVYRPVIITLLFFLFFSNKKTQGTPRPERAHTLSFKRYIPAPPSSLISSTEKIHSHKSFLFFSYFFCTRGNKITGLSRWAYWIYLDFINKSIRSERGKLIKKNLRDIRSVGADQP